MMMMIHDNVCLAKTQVVIICSNVVFLLKYMDIGIMSLFGSTGNVTKGS